MTKTLIRIEQAANYKVVFFNGKIIRQRLNSSLPILTPQYAEIEDVAINSLCYANCFISGTKVKTNNGYKNIEEISINDTVFSFNEELNDFEEKVVYELFKNKYSGQLIKITLSNDKCIYCTPNHKILTKNRRWVEAKNLLETDECISSIKIKKIETINNFDGYVYNFSVKDNHNYIVEDVVVSNCHYCYTSATKLGTNFENIVEKALEVWGSVEQNNRPFQIACGGAGESTIHPDWVKFVKTVKSLNIVPNYTTNGMHLSDEILKATEEYCGGVAVSYRPHIKNIFNKAIQSLSKIETRLNTHLIIGTKESLFDAQAIYETYKDDIEYFVMLPYQAAGRGKSIDVDDVWREMFIWIDTLPEERQQQFAFGALFYPWILKSELPLQLDIYEPEIYSGYRMMDDSYKTLRKSSYNLEPKFT